MKPDPLLPLPEGCGALGRDRDAIAILSVDEADELAQENWVEPARFAGDARRGT